MNNPPAPGASGSDRIHLAIAGLSVFAIVLHLISRFAYEVAAGSLETALAGSSAQSPGTP
ncbi:MAG: hypothetical protein P1U68_05710 [Verrucomicrobiales bacterium]|nr:hypothetical protein [Verrucomicrobiales bacterium]